MHHKKMLTWNTANSLVQISDTTRPNCLQHNCGALKDKKTVRIQLHPRKIEYQDQNVPECRIQAERPCRMSHGSFTP